MLKTLLLASALALPAAPVLAQQAAPDAPPEQAAVPSVQQASPSADDLYARVGEPVYSADGEKLGDLEDVRRGESGEVEHVVVSYGGLLGIGTRQVSVPPEAFSIQTGGDGGEPRLVVAMGRDQLEAQPEFDPRDAQSRGSLPGPTEGTAGRVVQPSAGGASGALTQRVEPESGPEAGTAAATAETEGLDTNGERAMTDAMDRVQDAWAQVESATADGWQAAKENFQQAVADLERTWQDVTAGEQQAQQPEGD